MGYRQCSTQWQLPHQSVLVASSIQQTALHTCIPPGRGIPRIWGRWLRLHIVLAVHSQSLDDLKGVLFVGIHMRVCRFEERG